MTSSGYLLIGASIVLAVSAIWFQYRALSKDRQYLRAAELVRRSEVTKAAVEVVEKRRQEARASLADLDETLIELGSLIGQLRKQKSALPEAATVEEADIRASLLEVEAHLSSAEEDFKAALEGRATVRSQMDEIEAAVDSITLKAEEMLSQDANALRWTKYSTVLAAVITALAVVTALAFRFLK